MSQTVTKEEIKAAVDQLPSEQLEALNQFIKTLALAHSTPKDERETFMEKLRKIEIDAPPDFSRNIDLYLSGEQTLD